MSAIVATPGDRSGPEPSAGRGVPAPHGALAEDLGGNVRSLFDRRRVAGDRALAYRRNGQLVPGSLTEEIAEIRGELQRAIERYGATMRVDS